MEHYRTETHQYVDVVSYMVMDTITGEYERFLVNVETKDVTLLGTLYKDAHFGDYEYTGTLEEALNYIVVQDSDRYIVVKKDTIQRRGL